MSDEAGAKVPEKKPKEYKDGPWGQKWMAGSDKKLAIEAASRAGQTMDEWLGEAIREKVARERAQPGDANYEVFPPEREDAVPPRPQSTLRMIEGPKPMSVEELSEAVELAVRLKEVRKLKHLPRAVLLAQRQLEKRITGE